MVWLYSKTMVPSVAQKTIERQRLVALLQKKDHKKLTIVQAPAGYGKTTLLSQWISQFDESVVWLSIDSTDNDPIRFWKYVLRIVSEVVPKNLNGNLIALINSQSPLELLIDSLLNEIELFQSRIHIVIDDYHLIENPVIHDMMARFIDYLPRNTCVYLTSRSEIPLPIANWHLKEWVTEIGVDQLRFTYEEMDRFYEKRIVSHENAETLHHVFSMTEGWAAGIQLADLSGQMSSGSEWDVDSFDSKHPYVTEFLLQEILASLSPSTQEFLVRTSILSQLEPVICNALTNRTDSYDLLLELERKGLFIVRLDSSEPIFRYHHLFADALQTELKHRYSSNNIALLYEDVAKSVREQGDFMSAIELLLQGQLYEVADKWLTVHLVEIFTLGQTATFIRWVRQLRDNDYPVNIETLVMYVITLSTNYEMEEASKLIMELNHRHEVDQWMNTIEYRGMASILETITAFVLLAGGKGIEQSMNIITNQIDSGRVSSKWDNIPMQYNWFEPMLLRTSIGGRGRLLWEEEVLPLLKLFQEADVQAKNFTGFALGVAAETQYYRNTMQRAVGELEAALQYGLHFKDPGLFIPMYILKSRIFAVNKQYSEAHANLDLAMETTKERHWIDSLRVMKAHCYLLEGNVLQAEKNLSESTGLNIQNAESEQSFWLLVYTRLLLAKKQTEEALITTIRVKERAIQERQVATILEATVLEAICHMTLGHEDIALFTLHEAIQLGAPYGYVRTFLDEKKISPLIRTYLKERQKDENVHWQSVSLSYVEQLIEDCTLRKELEKLTPREQAVLRLLTKGVANSDIARQLVLTEGSVRIYLTRIYSKLNVQSRTQAVLQAKEWGM